MMISTKPEAQMSIQTMIDDVLKKEGGYTDNPLDHGKCTNMGITLSTLDEFTGKKNGKDNIKALSQADAWHIYYNNYYIKPAIYSLPSALQPLIFDMAVNQGPHSAIKLLQLELKTLGYMYRAADGINGPITIAASKKAINDLGAKFINSVVNRRIDFYHAIVEAKPNQSMFLKGWIARAETFREHETV